jgi:quercetin dioxygenase-like cupin family protein
MNVLPSRGIPAREERPATSVLHDDEHVRVVGFHLRAGQEVPAHRSSSTVTVHVTEGAGVFRGDANEARLETGDAAVFAPGEVHSIRASEGTLRFIAILSPRPA